MLKEAIQKTVSGFVSRYQRDRRTTTAWREPIVGLASASDPVFETLRAVVSPTHALPVDLLAKAKTVVVFFLPFNKETMKNNVSGRMSSREWATAYLETNRLIQDLCDLMRAELEDRGHAAAVTPATHNFDPKKLVSDWSHRHVAYTAGLGRFGLNNMLITSKGCCGRLGSLVTTAEIEPDPRPEREACLYRHEGSCMKCVERCVNDALFETRFDRFKCYAMCLENEALHRALGQADVCGKCLVGVPCSRIDPVSKMDETS
jgi:epoxyqueuosine reductase QueG